MISPKRYLVSIVTIVICLMGFLPVGGPVHAQEDACTRDAVIASFAAAASSGSVDAWLQGYLDGACSATVQASAQALADTYGALGASDAQPAAPEGVLLEGEYPVIHVTDALGFESQLTVAGLRPTVDGLVMLCYSQCLVLEMGPGVYAALRFDRLRHVQYDPAAGQYVATIDTGEQFTGALISVLVGDDTGATTDVTGIDEITLYSLPEEQPAPEPLAPGEMWAVQVTAPFEAVYTGIPVFTYTYYSTSGYAIGGSDRNGTSTQFLIDVQGRDVSAEIASFQGIALTGAQTVELTMPDGRTASGAVKFIEHDSAGDHTAHTWGLALTLSDGVYLSFGSNAVLTLTRN
jgi:hypothetical protein